MQATSKSIFSLTVLAAAVVHAHRFVTVAGAETAVGDKPFGVSQNACFTGLFFAADRIGTALVQSSGVVVKGTEVAVDAGGMVQEGGTGLTTVGIALTSATSAGQLVEVLLAL